MQTSNLEKSSPCGILKCCSYSAKGRGQDKNED